MNGMDIPREITMRDEFTGAVQGDAKRYQNAMEKAELLHRRLCVMTLEEGEQDLHYFRKQEGRELVLAALPTIYERHELRVKANGACQVRESLNDQSDPGYSTGDMSFDDAQTLFIAKLAKSFPEKSREGVRQFLSGARDSVKVRHVTYRI